MIAEKRLQKFDYGIVGNLLHYNTTIPPAYYPEKMFKPPVALFTGGQDILAGIVSSILCSIAICLVYLVSCIIIWILSIYVYISIYISLYRS